MQNNITKYTTILFDFHGVLCHDHFYSSLDAEYPGLMPFISEYIFGKNSTVMDPWMRNEMTTDQIHTYITQHTGVSEKTLAKALKLSIENLNLDTRMLNCALDLQKQGKKVALVTDNIPEFTNISVQLHNIDTVFPVIINSADYRIIKRDQNGKLFEIAFEKLGVEAYKNTLLIDDTKTVGEIFKNNGGNVHRFTNYENFENWLKE